MATDRTSSPSAGAGWKPPSALVEALRADTGLFGPDSVTWRIGRENVLGALGGARALILQVAHPLVAAGVGEHSDYRRDPWTRLFGTLDATTAIFFGSAKEAEESARRVWEVHGKVRGKAPEGGGPHRKGTPYNARNPDLPVRVHATLVDTALLVYDRYVARLSLAERKAYYEEQKLFAEMFGVPRERQPETYADFNDYFDHMIEHELAVTDTLRDVVDATLVAPPLPLPLRPLRRPAGEAAKLLTAGLLPPRLREELGLGWGAGRERLTAAAATLGRTVLPAVPDLLRLFPRARAAERRLKAA
jgi:uncharacterized protein (DUF2236 family)